MLSQILNLAANDTPQNWIATPAGSHLANIADSSDTSYIQGSFLSAPSDWFRLPGPSSNLDALRQTLWRIRHNTLVDAIGVDFALLLEIYKADKVSLIGTHEVDLVTTGGIVEMPLQTLAVVASRAEMEAGLYVRFRPLATNPLSESNIKIVRATVQYMYIEQSPVRVFVHPTRVIEHNDDERIVPS